jgi:hypothetical protein
VWFVQQIIVNPSGFILTVPEGFAFSFVVFQNINIISSEYSSGNCG